MDVEHESEQDEHVAVERLLLLAVVQSLDDSWHSFNS